MTLYVVGDLERSTADTVKLIEKTFGRVPPGRELLPGGLGALASPLPAAAVAAAAGMPLATNGARNGKGAHYSSEGVGDGEVALGPLKQRHKVRPPVVHKWGYGPLAPGGWRGGEKEWGDVF